MVHARIRSGLLALVIQLNLGDFVNIAHRYAFLGDSTGATHTHIREIIGRRRDGGSDGDGAAAVDHPGPAAAKWRRRRYGGNRNIALFANVRGNHLVC